LSGVAAAEGGAIVQVFCTPVTRRYVRMMDRTASIGINMTRSPSGERMKPCRS